MSRKVVYLSMQYRGREKQAEEIALAWVKYAVRRGYAPVVPWLNYVKALDDKKADDRIAGIECDREIITRCDEFWICGSPPNDSMAWQEEHYAIQSGVTTRRFTTSELPPMDVDYE